MSKITDLAAELRKLLESGCYPAGARFPSEYELMNRYQVARLTANKAVALLTAEGLLERGRRGSGTFVRRERRFPRSWIAVLANVAHPYYARIVAGAANAALAEHCMIAVFNPQLEDFSATLRKIEQSDCLGVLTMNYGVLPREFAKPVIYLDTIAQEDEYETQHCVLCDNYDAASEMMEWVLGQGCREVVTVTVPGKLHRRMRLKGFQDAMEKFGIPDAPARSFVVQGSHSRYEMQQTVRSILKRFPGVKYIVTDSDDIVLRIMEVCKIDGIDCPGRIKLTGFGNIHGIADIHHIPTVDQHPGHIGAEGVNAMLKLVERGTAEPVIHIQVPAEVIRPQFI